MLSFAHEGVPSKSLPGFGALGACLNMQDAMVPYFLRLKKQLAMSRYFSAFAFLPFVQGLAC